MDVRYKLKDEALTSEQIKRLEELKNRPINIDSESLEITENELETFMRAQDFYKMLRKKETVSLRLDNESIRIAKKIDDKYTSLLSRILYKALRDPEYIKDCL